MENQNEPSSQASLKQKLKSSLRLSWLRHRDNPQTWSAPATPYSTPVPSPKNITSPRDLPHKCRDLINRIGHGNSNHRRSHSQSQSVSQSQSHSKNCNSGHGRPRSMEFRYDSSNYALNFDKGCEDSEIDEFPNRNFTSRLPQSPASSSTSFMEITTCT
ncbi:hypothetical protein V6N11_057388 [Hibiscus sabdariffa]|uniref:Uncharacterized protein n=2 Tax=Hibiscus sabdariffa TaxID=183260 RepID=A0ABR2B3B4_9ROSI